MESFGLGVNTTVIGMGVVFCVLIILSISTWALSAIVDKLNPPKITPPAAQPKASVAVAPAPAKAQEGINAQIVAAITAAVVAVTGTPANQLKFTSIQRMGGSNLPWAASGNAEIMSNRQRFTEGGNK